MVLSRDRDGDKVDLIEQPAIIRQRFALSFSSDLPTFFRIGIGNADKVDILESEILMRMETPEITDPDNTCT